MLVITDRWLSVSMVDDVDDTYHHDTTILPSTPNLELIIRKPANSHHYTTTVSVLMLPYTTLSSPWWAVANPPSRRMTPFHRKKTIEITAPKTVRAGWKGGWWEEGWVERVGWLRGWVERVGWKGALMWKDGLRLCWKGELEGRKGCKGHLLSGRVTALLSPLLVLPPNRLLWSFLLWWVLVVTSTSHHTLCWPEETRKWAG